MGATDASTEALVEAVHQIAAAGDVLLQHIELPGFSLLSILSLPVLKHHGQACKG